MQEKVSNFRKNLEAPFLEPLNPEKSVFYDMFVIL